MEKFLCSEGLFKRIILTSRKELSMDDFSETRSLAVMSLIVEGRGEHITVTESLNEQNSLSLSIWC